MDHANAAHEQLAIRTNGHILIMTIDRPEKRNAVNAAVASGISTALQQLEDGDDLWVGVITGSGGFFSAGADIRAGAAGEAITNGYGWGGIAQFPRTKPLIAAVEVSPTAVGARSRWHAILSPPVRRQHSRCPRSGDRSSPPRAVSGGCQVEFRWELPSKWQ